MKLNWVVIVALLLTLTGYAEARGGGGHSGGHSSHNSGTVHVNSYTRKDGTYVQAHDRSAPGSGSLHESSHTYSDHTPSELHEPVKTEHKAEHTSNDSVKANIDSSAKTEALVIPSVPKGVKKSGKADNYYDGKGILREKKTGKIHRSQAAKRAFQKQKPCPSTGKTSGACPGYVIDHIQALKHGGKDDPSNMQWQTVSEAKAKDKWE